MRLEADRPAVLRQVMMVCRSGTTVLVAGAHSGFVDKFPIGTVMIRSIAIKSGQVPVQRYLHPLLARVERGEDDPRFVITHRLPLEQAAAGDEPFKRREEGCMTVVVAPCAGKGVGEQGAEAAPFLDRWAAPTQHRKTDATQLFNLVYQHIVFCSQSIQ